MANISGNLDEKVFAIKTFLGLNENPDGDTKLKMGEAAVLRNFRITRDGNLQRRPGTKTLVNLGNEKPIKGLWTGFVNGHEYMIGACDGKLYKFWDDVSNEFKATPIGRACGTFSGPVASFETDGRYPIDSLSVAVEPRQDLHGYDSPWPAGGGKNLYDANALNPLSNSGITATVSNGTITLNGTATANAYFTVVGTGLPSGNYAFSFNNPVASSDVHAAFRDSGEHYFSDIRADAVNKSVAFTGEPIDIILYVKSGATVTNFVVKPQLESGSTATAWTPYSNICPISGRTSATIYRSGADTSNPTTYTITLGQTVYGGTLDAVNGTMTVEWGMYTYNGSEDGWSTFSATQYGLPYFRNINFYQEWAGSVIPFETVVGDYYKSNTGELHAYQWIDGNSSTPGQYGLAIGYGLRAALNGLTPDDITLAEWKTWLSSNPIQLLAKLKNPITITLDPVTISTLVGQNNVWSDAGDVTVTTDTSQTQINTDGDVHIFGFSNICYIMDGVSYKQYDGTSLTDVVGYRPLVTISVPPAGGGETLENVNRLNGMRRLWISTTGEDATYFLPEKQIKSIDYVKNLATGEALPSTDYTASLGDEDTFASVTFNSIPAQATNGYEIGWTIENANTTAMRAQVTSMRYSEIYSGRQDARVFIYGDGTNKCLYSGIDYNGNPRADYFPDLYEISVGDANTPITAMIRHYFSLMCYKSNSAWMIEATNYTLADNAETPAFWVVPINRAIGNAAPGQVRLVLNSPYTLFGNDLYEWKNNASYASNLNVDERQAKRISDRVWATIKTFDVSKCYCFDDNDAQEYYICYDGQALVYNYAANAWSYYTQFPVSCMVFLQKELFIGSPDGKLKRVSYEYLNDDGEAVDAYWESGSLGFGADYLRKYAAMLWIGIKPETSSEVWVTVQTDRNSQLQEKVVATYMATFSKANFARWSFRTNRKPHMTRLKIKAKKFVFYKLIFESSSADTRATILAADIRVRMTGYAK